MKDFENVSKELSDKQKIGISLNIIIVNTFLDIHTIFVKLRTSLNLHEDSVSSVSNKYLA